MRVLDKEGLLAIISSLTGLSSYATTWADDSAPMVSDQDRASVSLKLFGLTAVGVDEHRRYFNAPDQPANSFETTEIGNRHITITVRAECFDGGVEASELIDRIRTGVRAEVVTMKLNALKLAFVWATPTHFLPLVYNERLVSAATMDVTLAGIARQVTSVEIGSGWIDTVDTTNTVPGTFNP